MKRVPKTCLDSVSRRTGKTLDDVQSFVRLVRESANPATRDILVSEMGEQRMHRVTRHGVGPIVTHAGKFWQYDFHIDDDWEKYSVLVKCELDHKSLNPTWKDASKILLRTDSGCETGQVFADLTCECSDQLKSTMKLIEEAGEGMIINIPRQDGRGMGLPFKLGTLWLQEELGVNTVESASLMSSDGIIDIRSYSGVICILKFLGVHIDQEINLATNNPYKAKVFAENGYKLAEEYVPVVIEATSYTRQHLAAKKAHLEHRL